MKTIKKQMKDKTMIVIDRDNHKELMMFKIQTNAKNVNEVIKLLIKKLKEELK